MRAGSHLASLAHFLRIKLGCAAVFTVCFAGSLICQAPRPFTSSKLTEYDVKAAYLFNFGKFVRWPAAPSAREFNLCILGDDPFGPALDSLVENETVDGKRITVSRISSPGQAATCKIVFISSSEERHLKPMLSALHQSPVLTVSDISGFVSQGGMIGFIADRGRIRFEVNLSASDSAGVKFSSELLRVAAHVVGGVQR
jgi:hypothetical protein